MLNLRRKLEASPRDPVHLLTVHGAGYRLVLDAPEPEGEPSADAPP